MPLNSQQKRVNKSRVSITYDVETNGAVETKELPFVVGVIGDFSGDKQDKPDVEERDFLTVDKDNFDSVMAHIAPELTLTVDNLLENDGSQFSTSLKFNAIKDFEPASLVQQIEPLKRLVETRNQLKVLLAKADRSKELEKLLKDVLQDEQKIKQLTDELGIETETESI